MFAIQRAVCALIEIFLFVWSSCYFLAFVATFICSLFVVSTATAAEITIAPEVSYLRHTTTGTVQYSSVSELISDANTTEEILYNKCIQIGSQSNAFTCRKNIFTSEINSPSAT
jgi:hypothetical protein